MRDEITDFGERFDFGERTSEVFDDMISRSIPGYEEMRSLTYRVGRHFVGRSGTLIDIGSSTGDGYSFFTMTDARIISCELSEPMVEVQRERYGQSPNVDIRACDVVTDFPSETADLVQSILTLQFIAVEDRQRVVRSAYESLRDGGALVAVEKVIGSTAQIEDLLVEEYYSDKRENGYTDEQIDRKRLALRGILVPQTDEANVTMLRAAGFRSVEQFWRHLNFVGYLAIK